MSWAGLERGKVVAWRVNEVGPEILKGAIEMANWARLEVIKDAIEAVNWAGLWI